MGIIASVGLDADAEITFVATPVLTLEEQVRSALSNTSGLVTDVGSVKSAVVAAIDDPRFVGGHPMAGSELEGLDGADPTMFEGAVWVLTPSPTTADQTFAGVAAVVAELGADVVVDPRETPAIEAWRKIDGQKPLVIFEAVGVPGMIESAMRMAPKNARILVVGVCMQTDHIHPMLGIGRELNIQFVLGYDPMEFAGSLQAIAEGKVDLTPWHTGTVGIDAVPQAFADLANPDRHAKILVVPGS